MKWLSRGLWVVVWLAFFARGMIMLDPDFGWHLRLGEMTVSEGLAKREPFSYSMASYYFVDYEWLTNAAIYWMYEWAGMAGLAAVFALLAMLALEAAVPEKWREYRWPGLILGWAVLWGRSGVRPQVLSWVLLAVVVRMLDRQNWKRWRWAFGILMAVWANLHGSWPVGLAAAAVVIGWRWLEARKIEFEDIAAGGLGALAVLVNPYGWKLAYEVGRQMIWGGKLMRIGIQEWLPWYTSVELAFWMLLVLAMALGWRYRRAIGREWWAVAAFLAWAGTASLRNMALFAVMGVPLAAEGVGRLRAESDGKRFGVVYRLLAGLAGVLLGVEVALLGIEYMLAGERGYYPVRTVEYLRTLDYRGNLFSNYGWGGDLIWKYPEKKEYIDGRMANFVGYEKPGETGYVFREYLGIGEVEITLGEIFNKYDVEVVLWPRKKPGRMVWNIKLPAVFGGRDEKIKDFWEEMDNLGWDKIYEDETAVVYRRPSG